jgi:FKBP-type peptidyl-prolyl cis-trans isomerase FkpA
MLHLRFCQALLVAACIVLAACGSSSPVAPDQSNVSYSQTDLTVGTGAAAAAGNNVSVTYTLWLYSTSAADHKGSQLGSGAFSFVLGAGQVIPGFDQGVTGMQVGGSRRLVVPPALAYGTAGNGPIPPNAALVFEVQLVGIQ